MAEINNLVTLTTKIKTWAVSKFAAISHNHSNDYEAKNSNIQLHISSVSNPHAVTKSQVGLSDVTNNKQIKASASSTDGTIPVWSGTAGDALTGGYVVETTLTNTETNIPTSSAVYTAVDNMSAGLGTLKNPVDDLAALKALDTTNASTYPDKCMVCCEPLGLYRLDRESTGTNDNKFIVQPTTGTGRWLLMATSTASHSLLSGLQGGTTNQYYHLTQSQNQAMPSGISSSNKLIAADSTVISKLSTTDGTLDSDNLTVAASTWASIDALLV